MKRLRLWTDGACARRGRRLGGWAFVAEEGGKVIFEKAARAERTTSNKMELRAAIEGLRWVAANHDAALIEVISDSTYLVNGATKWMPRWKANDWKLAIRGGQLSAESVKNVELWQELDELIAELSPIFRWVRGHNGEELNERADKLAKEGLEGRSVIRRPG